MKRPHTALVDGRHGRTENVGEMKTFLVLMGMKPTTRTYQPHVPTSEKLITLK